MTSAPVVESRVGTLTRPATGTMTQVNLPLRLAWPPYLEDRRGKCGSGSPDKTGLRQIFFNPVDPKNPVQKSSIHHFRSEGDTQAIARSKGHREHGGKKSLSHLDHNIHREEVNRSQGIGVSPQFFLGVLGSLRENKSLYSKPAGPSSRGVSWSA